MSKNAVEELTIKSIQFKSGDITPKDYYKYLFNRARFASVDFGTMPNLVKYAEYIKKYEAIDKVGLYKEIEEIESALLNNLAKNEDQQILLKLDNNLSILKDMFSLRFNSFALSLINKISSRHFADYY